MKNKLLFPSALTLLIALGLSTGTMSVVHAADSGSTTGSDTTSVSVTSGDLTIGTVPNLSFTSSVDSIANATGNSTVKLSTPGNIVTTDDQGYGTDTSWSLSAVPSGLTYTGGDGKPHNLGVASLTIDGKTISAIDGKTSTVVATGTNEGNTTTSLTGDNTSVTLAPDKQVFGTNYTGTITWTLTGNTGTIGGTASSTTGGTTTPAE